jgi:5-hydroxyisourate hydrolase-like protein (transthyretin family)
MNVKLHPIKFLTLAVACLWLLSSSSALLAAGGKVSGQVLNGTTGSPVSNQTLQLLMPRGGMQQVATAVTDSNGQFVVAASDLATDSFYLLQADYQGVNYHAPVKFDDRGQARADITVYDATRTAPPVRIQSARIILHAEGDKVHVQEMFAIRNSADPPRSYVNPDGTFLFHLRQDRWRSHRRGGRFDEHAAAAAREPRQRAGQLQYSVPPEARLDGDDGGLRWRLRFE